VAGSAGTEEIHLTQDIEFSKLLAADDIATADLILGVRWEAKLPGDPLRRAPTRFRLHPVDDWPSFMAGSTRRTS